MKNSDNKINIYRYIFLGIALLIIVSAFFTAVTFNTSYEEEIEGVMQPVTISLKYNGWDLILGRSVPELQLYGSVNEEFITSIKPSIMIIIAYFLPMLGGLVFLFLRKDRHITGFIMTGCFLISAIILFMTLRVCSMNIDVYNGIYIVEQGSASLQSIGYQISFGPIIGALLGCIGTFVSFSLAMQKDK